jgi:hypothetical protein
MGLYRRLSAKFNKSSAYGSNQASVNGTSSLGAVEEHPPQGSGTQTSKAQADGTRPSNTNGNSIGQSLESTKDVNRRHSSFASKPQPGPAQRRESKDSPAASREDVEGAFEEFAQLIHASRRPLPTQTGDGSYLEKDEPTGFWQDAKHLRLKDVATVKEIMVDKASGKPQQDRDMHMEHIMQVSDTVPANDASDPFLSLWLHSPPNLKIVPS